MEEEATEWTKENVYESLNAEEGRGEEGSTPPSHPLLYCKNSRIVMN
jgi:hypothetical protein